MQQNNNQSAIYVVALLFVLVAAQSSSAVPLFEADVTSTDADVSYHVTFSTSQQVVDELKEATLESRVSGYTNDMDITSCINYRGLPITLTYGSNSTELVLEVAEIGLSKRFNGETREESVQLFESWLKDNDDDVKKFYRALVKKSAIDFLAGNPNSLMANMVEADFESGLNIDEFRMEQLGTGFSFASFDQGGYISNKFSFPNKYTFQNTTNGSFTFKIPVAITLVNSAESFQSGLGLVYNHPINDYWGISPSVNYGLGGSKDLGSAGSIISGSLTNVFRLKEGLSVIALASMLGYYKTLEFNYEGYSIDPDISNTVLRNGFYLQHPTLAEGYYMQYFAIDTQYFGSELFLQRYNEFGFALGFLEYFKFGVTYSTSSKSSGVMVNFRVAKDLG